MFTIHNKQLWLTSLKNNSVIETLIELHQAKTTLDCYIDFVYLEELLTCCLDYFNKVDYFTSYEQYQYFISNVDYSSFVIDEIKHLFCNTNFTFKILRLNPNVDKTTYRHLERATDNTDTFIYFFNLDRSLKKGERNHFKNIIQWTYLKEFFWTYGRKYLTNINKINYEDKLETLNNVVERYNCYFFNPKNNVDTLEKQLDLLKTYEKHFKQYGGYLHGEKLTIEEMLDQNKLKQRVANIFKTKNRQLCKPLVNLPQMSGGWEVKQLNTMLDLIEEGQFQHNCIGSSSYSYAIERNNGVAMSLRKNEKRHTIFFRSNKVKWSIEQDLTFANKQKEEVFDDYDVKLLNYNIQVLLEYLNKNKVQSKKIVEELF